MCPQLDRNVVLVLLADTAPYIATLEARSVPADTARRCNSHIHYFRMIWKTNGDETLLFEACFSSLTNL